MLCDKKNRGRNVIGTFGDIAGVMRCVECNCYCSPGSCLVCYRCSVCKKVFCFECGEDKGGVCCNLALGIYGKSEV